LSKEYSLDTSTCVNLIRGENVKTRHHFAHAVKSGHSIGISSIVSHELWFGAVKSVSPERSRRALEIFLTGVVILDFDNEDAIAAGEVRANLGKLGKSIGPFDTLIGAQALRRKLTLVSDNVREFRRIAGLTIENWCR
jgi:tRNA(fMet)-specific endonuclease VapC